MLSVENNAGGDPGKAVRELGVGEGRGFAPRTWGDDNFPTLSQNGSATLAGKRQSHGNEGGLLGEEADYSAKAGVLGSGGNSFFRGQEFALRLVGLRFSFDSQLSLKALTY